MSAPQRRDEARKTEVWTTAAAALAEEVFDSGGERSVAPAEPLVVDAQELVELPKLPHLQGCRLCAKRRTPAPKTPGSRSGSRGPQGLESALGDGINGAGAPEFEPSPCVPDRSPGNAQGPLQRARVF